MADSSSRKAVVAAIGANLFITVAKFVGYYVSGSGAMLGEAIHTLADLFNQILLYVGIERARRPPSPRHPYGYEAEAFVFALISAVGIFFLGCGVTVYHGVHTLMHPEPIEFSWLAIGILALGFVIDGAVLLLAFNGLRAAAGDRPFLQYLKTDADPAAMAVLLEDSVASVGVIVALAGMGLSLATGDPLWDSLGTLLIGLMLGFVAVYLVVRNRDFLVGRAAPDDMTARFHKVLEESPAVQGFHDVKSRMHGSDKVRFKVEVDFDGRVLAQRLEPLMEERYPTIDDYPAFRTFCGDFAEEVVQQLSAEIDELEARVRAQIPEARHVDIESD